MGTLSVWCNISNVEKRLTHCFSMRTASIDAYFNHWQMLSFRLPRNFKWRLKSRIHNELVKHSENTQHRKECNRIDRMGRARTHTQMFFFGVWHQYWMRVQFENVFDHALIDMYLWVWYDMVWQES